MKCQCNPECTKEIEPIEYDRNAVMNNRIILRKYSKECAKRIANEQTNRRKRNRVTYSALAFGAQKQ